MESLRGGRLGGKERGGSCVGVAGRTHGGREKPVGGFAPAVVNTKSLAQCRRERDVTGNTAFAGTDVDHHALGVDVGDFELAQFVAAKAGGIEGGHDGPVFEIVRVVQNAGNLILAQYGYADRPFLRCGDLFVEPGLFENPDVEKLESGAVDLDGGPGVMLVFQ